VVPEVEWQPEMVADDDVKMEAGNQQKMS